MPHLGTQPPTGFKTTTKQSFSGDNSTTAFTLNRASSSETDLEVFVDNIQQEPTTAYSVSGTTLTFTEAPPTGTNNIYVVNRGGDQNGLLPPQDLGTTDYIFGDDISFNSDSAKLNFGADSEITITHVADTGLNFKHTATGDDKPIILTLQTGETDIAADDVLGAINFQAPDEGTGTDAILVAAGIEAVSEGDFSSSSNATKLSFKTAASAAAAETMALSSAGNLTVAGTITPTGAITANAGVVIDNITIDGTEIDLSSGDLTIDVAGDITLDANGQQIFFAKGGTTFGQFGTESTPSSFTIESTVSDGDIVFKGSDGGSSITALTLDMSEDGHATFKNGVTLADGNLKFADAHGIDFSSTSDATGMVSELLDDYEEGTWTPELDASSGSFDAAYSFQAGAYTKVGRMVHAHGQLGVSNTPSTASGDLRVRNFPFTANSAAQHLGIVGFYNNFTSQTDQASVSIDIDGAATFATVRTHEFNGSSGYNAVPLGAAHNANQRITVQIVYFV